MLRMFLIALIATAIVLVGCGSSTSGTILGKTDIPVGLAAPVAVGSNPASVSSRTMAAPTAPVRAVVCIDYTGSTTETRTPRVSAADFTPLLDLLRVTGGEAALCLITDRSDRPLLRIRVAVPPRPPAPLAPSSATRDCGSLTWIEAEQCKRQNAAAQATAETEHAVALRTYDGEQLQWQQNTDAAINAFQREVAIVLARPREGNTDIWLAVQRISVFLREPAQEWPRAPHQWAVLVTDGQDNQALASPPNRTELPGQLIVVNGNAETGDLAMYHPTTFEAVAAALRQVVAVEKGAR